MPVRLGISPVTRPAASTPEDIAGYEKEMDNQRERDLIGYDVRLTKFLGWAALLGLSLMTGAITWSAATLVGLKSDVAVLLARPEGVSRLEYDRDYKHFDDEIAALKRRHEREDK